MTHRQRLQYHESRLITTAMSQEPKKRVLKSLPSLEIQAQAKAIVEKYWPKTIQPTELHENFDYMEKGFAADAIAVLVQGRLESQPPPVAEWKCPSKGELPEDEQCVWIVLIGAVEPFLAVHYDDDGISRFMSKERKHTYTIDKVWCWSVLPVPSPPTPPVNLEL